ncbi:extensin family protein [Aestuariibius sp. 2305UL40-4]|uniref:extensin-like domain-containing protein n=1 Tax=Aestuariibius violaceus TaxID=3234132 RepID=UPI00345E8EAA
MRAALILLLVCSEAAAQDSAPDTSLLPQARPTEAGSPALADPEDREEEVAPDAEDATEPPVRETLREDDADFAACLSRLDGFGTVYQEREAILDPDDGDCGILRPVEVTEVVPGLSLRPDAVMRCETAAALAEWVSGSVQPAADLIESYGAVTGIEHGSTYICRRRNNAAEGKLSEHSFGNAVDVMAFLFENGERIPIEPRADSGTIEEAFQRAVRGAACLSFTTVLGPGTDATHEDHLHMDVKARRGGYRICQ